MNTDGIALVNADSNASYDALAGIAAKHSFTASAAALETFVGDWERGILPKTRWTHGAHVGVAAYFAFEHSPEALFQIMKLGIRHHNLSVGTANTDDSGYHETLTRFWSESIGAFVRHSGFPSRLEAVRNSLARFAEDRKRYELFYSFDVVRDRRARREWVLPDRAPIADS